MLMRLRCALRETLVDVMNTTAFRKKAGIYVDFENTDK